MAQLQSYAPGSFQDYMQTNVNKASNLKLGKKEKIEAPQEETLVRSSTTEPNYLQVLKANKEELRQKLENRPKETTPVLNFGAKMSGPGITNIEDYKARLPKEPEPYQLQDEDYQMLQMAVDKGVTKDEALNLLRDFRLQRDKVDILNEFSPEQVTGLGEQLKSRVEDFKGAKGNIRIPTALGFIPEKRVQQLGAIYGGLTDVLGVAFGNAVKDIYEKSPEIVQEKIKDLGNTKQVKEALGAIQLGGEMWQDFAEKNPRLAKDIGGTLATVEIAGTAGLAPQKTITTPIKAGQVVLRGGEKAVKKTGEGIADTAEYSTKLLTGLNRETQQIIKNNPKLFQAIKKGEITPESITGDVKTNIEKRLNNLSETGKGYQVIKQSPIKFEKNTIQSIIDNRLENEGLSKNLIELPIEDRKAVKQAQFYLNEIPSEQLTTKQAVELKAKLRSLVSYDKGVSPEGERVVKGIIKDLDNHLKENIPGYKELDAVYGPEREFLNKVRKDILNKDGTLKDNAISTIRNLTGKGKEMKINRLESIIPGITEKVKGIKAFEDLQNAIEGKTGGYARSLLLGGGGYAFGGPIGGIITFAITHPNIASKALELYGLSRAKIKSLFNKITTNTPLNKIEQKQIKDAVQIPPNKLFNNLIKDDGISPINNMDNISGNIQQTKQVKPSILSDREKALLKPTPQQSQELNNLYSDLDSLVNNQTNKPKNIQKTSKTGRGFVKPETKKPTIIKKREPKLSDKGGIETIIPEYQHKFNQGPNYKSVRVISNPRDSKIIRYGALENKQKQSVIGKGSKLTEGEKLELKSIEKELGLSREQIMARSNEIKEMAKQVRKTDEQVILDLNKPKKLKKKK